MAWLFVKMAYCNFYYKFHTRLRANVIFVM